VDSVTHTNGSGGAFDINQGDWAERAKQTLQEPLPPGVNRTEYEKAVKLAITGHKQAVAVVNKVIELQESQRTAQERVQAVQPDIETDGDESVLSRLTETSAGESDGAPVAPDNDTSQQKKKKTEGEKIEEVRKLLAEGKELPAGWKCTENGNLIPPGYRVNAAGFLLPEESKEDLKKQVEDIKGKKKLKKTQERELKKNLSKLKAEAKAACEDKIADLAAEVEQLEKDLEAAEFLWRAAPVE